MTEARQPAGVLGRWSRAVVRWLRWLAEREQLPAAPPPASGSRSGRLGSVVAWLLAAETLEPSEPVSERAGRDSALRWLLLPEPVPSASISPPLAGSRRPSPVKWLLGRDRLPGPPPAKEQRRGPSPSPLAWLLRPEPLATLDRRDQEDSDGAR